MTLETAPREILLDLIGKQEIRIQKLAAQILILQQENQALKEQLKTKVSPPPFSIKPNTSKKKRLKKRARRKKNYARKREIPTQIIKHAFSHCPDCGSELYEGWLKGRRQVIDIPVTPVAITEHQTFAHWCSGCKKKVYPKVDLSEQVLGNHRVSLNLMGFIATLREELRLPVRVIQGYFKIFHQLCLSYGEIMEILHTVADLGKPAYDELGNKIRGSPVVHGDETGWRENGQNGYIWNFNTPKIKYLLHKKSRGKQVVEEVIGEEFEGVLVTDFYASYNVHLGFHQRCWVHLLRDIKKLLELYPDHEKLKDWSKKVIGLYQEAKVYPGPDKKKYPYPRHQNQRRWADQALFRDRLLVLCRPYLKEETPMTTLCRRIDKYQDELFLFVANPEVPPDNNSAERSLRHSVIARKISGGTRSTKGSQTKFILASLFGTWKLQNRNPFKECLSLLKTASTQAQPVLQTLPRV